MTARQSREVLIEAFKADPEPWVDAYMRALEVIKELEERIISKRLCEERSRRYLETERSR